MCVSCTSVHTDLQVIEQLTQQLNNPDTLHQQYCPFVEPPLFTLTTEGKAALFFEESIVLCVI